MPATTDTYNDLGGAFATYDGFGSTDDPTDPAVRNGQLKIRGVLTGVGTLWHLDKQRFSGLGNPAPDGGGDMRLDHASGVILGHAYTGPRLITAAYTMQGSPDEAGELFEQLSDLWDPTEDDPDIYIYVREWGLGLMRFVGQPRGLMDRLEMIDSGVARALGTFACSESEPVRAPKRPVITAATPGAGQVALTWTAPSSDGGSPILGYTLYRYVGSTLIAATDLGVVLTSTVTGLTAGVRYTFKVAADNAVGIGALSTSKSATPT